MSWAFPFSALSAHRRKQGKQRTWCRPRSLLWQHGQQGLSRSKQLWITSPCFWWTSLLDSEEEGGNAVLCGFREAGFISLEEDNFISVVLVAFPLPRPHPASLTRHMCSHASLAAISVSTSALEWWKAVQPAPVLQCLHWFPIAFWEQFRVLILSYKALNGLGSTYLTAPSWCLRLAESILLQIPFLLGKKCMGSRIQPLLLSCETPSLFRSPELVLGHLLEALRDFSVWAGG